MTLPSKKVRCIDTGEIFESAAEAAKKYNRHRACIVACCRGKTKTSAGLRWEWYEQRPTAVGRASLCWDCRLADHWVDEPIVCPWAREGKPVEDWTALPTQRDVDKRKMNSFNVRECPLFKPDERRPKK